MLSKGVQHKLMLLFSKQDHARDEQSVILNIIEITNSEGSLLAHWLGKHLQIKRARVQILLGAVLFLFLFLSFRNDSIITWPHSIPRWLPPKSQGRNIRPFLSKSKLTDCFVLTVLLQALQSTKSTVKATCLFGTT